MSRYLVGMIVNNGVVQQYIMKRVDLEKRRKIVCVF